MAVEKGVKPRRPGPSPGSGTRRRAEARVSGSRWGGAVIRVDRARWKGSGWCWGAVGSVGGQWAVFSHAGSELQLWHTQVIVPTVQNDAGLEGTCHVGG